MAKAYIVLICDSHRPRIHGGGCCSDKGGGRLATQFQELLDQYPELAGKVTVRDSGCLRNCRLGINLKVMPDNVLYGKMKAQDLPLIIESHLMQGKPVEHLRIGQEPRYLSF
ncbi:MAG: (2Fe-2S) ferredoxin domain-containing protein [Bacteroidota bacterium]